MNITNLREEWKELCEISWLFLWKLLDISPNTYEAVENTNFWKTSFLPVKKNFGLISSPFI